MTTSRILDWLNLNSHRNYPFIGDTAMAIPTQLIVDFKLVSEITELTDVKLVSISKAISDITFRFNTGTHNINLAIASSEIDDTKRYHRLSESTSGYTVSLVVSTKELLELIEPDTYNYSIEPICYTSQKDYRVDSIKGLNDQYFADFSPGGVSPREALTGDITIKCGYGISAAVDESIIYFTALPGYGDVLGNHCFKLHDIPSCKDSILKLNGVPADMFGQIDLVPGAKIETKVFGNTLEIKSTISGDKPYCKERISA